MSKPADELRAAAEKLRDLAARAMHEDRPHWATGHTLGSRSPVVLDHPEKPSVLIETYAARLEDVNRYIAAMGPDVGAALTELMRFEADLIERVPGAELRGRTTHLLAVARQILGGQP